MIRKVFEKIGGKNIFVIVIAVLYLITAILNFGIAKSAFLKSIFLIQKIAPIFILVFALIFLTNIFLDPKKINKSIGIDAGFKGWLTAIIGGILSLGPIYMWYPLLSDLKEKGAKDAFIVCFLYNRAVKIPLMPMMIYYFGIPFTIMISIYMILFSVINGFVVEKLVKLTK
ncbi:MAG: hypothetical protein U9O55_04380 [Patescibacteria group bacterium]|nr:hypothetical protein [Patescibacteria group bacterium]